jgi:hypothetical protein
MKFIKGSAKDMKGTVSILASEISLTTEQEFAPTVGEWYVLYIRSVRGKKKHMTIFQCNKDKISLRTSLWPIRLKEPTVGKLGYIEYNIDDIYGPFTELELLETIL